ncbi:MAG: cell division protein SepF [Erysipelotrichaceae bacterium]|nr:cell division protein SepF [Erysipelotrichaceae bacterium]
MGIKKKFIDFIAPIEEDNYESDAGELEVTREEAKAISSYEAPKTKINRVSSDTKMVLFEPRSFEEAEEIARHLKQRRACVVNLHRLQRDYAQRTIDFLTGVVFALDGTIQKIAHNAILLTPSTIGVDGVISLEQDE